MNLQKVHGVGGAGEDRETEGEQVDSSMPCVQRLKALTGLILSQNFKKQRDWCKGVDHSQGRWAG